MSARLGMLFTWGPALTVTVISVWSALTLLPADGDWSNMVPASESSSSTSPWTTVKWSFSRAESWITSSYSWPFRLGT